MIRDFFRPKPQLPQVPEGFRAIKRLPGLQRPMLMWLQRKWLRRLTGTLRPRRCPRCQTPTVQVAVRREPLRQGKAFYTRTIRRCLPCGTEFYGRTIVRRR